MAHAFRMARVDNILDIVEVHKDDIINRHEVRFTLDLYSYFYEDRDIFRIILCENRDPLFGRALIETAHARFNPIRLFDEQDEDQASLLAIVCDQQFDFLIGGLLTIADNWLAEKNEATVEEVAICAAEFLHACSNKTTLKCLKELLKNQDNPEMMKVIGDTNAKRLRRKRSDTTLYSTRLS
mgnify:CR=1 FL=1